jgi:hypothetical protein
MRSPKSILLFLAIIWSRAKIWSHPLQAYALFFRAVLRKKLTDKGNTIFGVSVYVLKGDYDLTKGQVLLQDSFDLIKEKSPVLVESLKRVFSSIIICDRGSVFTYFPMDQCLLINALTLPKINESDLRISWAVQMMLIASGAVLLKGRHGYTGIRYVEILKKRAGIRFAHRCIVAENHLYVLSILNLLNKKIDHLRPERRYYERFLRNDLQKFSFGKKLAVAADGIRIVEVEASDP